MFKAILVSLNLLALIAIKLFFGGDITVDQKIPESIAAGESFTVEVSIEKSDREGFAKWQQTIPEGFIATAKESAGATFSFKNQNVKLIWMALPETETILISYDIAVDPSLMGEFNFDGKFSFIEENERKDILAEIKTLTIVNAQVADLAEVEDESTSSTEDSNQDKKDQKKEKKNKKDADTTASSNEEVLADNNAQDQKVVTEDDGIKISRSIEHLQNGEYLVNLVIEKGVFNSFGKVEEYLPDGFTASSNENESGIFSFDDKKVKILWMALPKSNTINISYNMKSESDLLDKVAVHGMFSYLKIDESIQLEMKPSKFKNYYVSSETDAIAQVEEESDEEENELPANKEDLTTNGEDRTEETTTEAEVNNESETVADNSIDAPESDESKEDLTESITDIPSAETNINYKVQIAAGRSEVKQDYFISRHGITESVSIEYHDNWYKYTLGSYVVYKQARDRRNDIWASDNKINDAFVTAYNSGERISVQEALMISKQEWFK